MTLTELIKIPESIYIDPMNREEYCVGKTIDSFFKRVYDTLIDKLKIPKKFQMGQFSHFERRFKNLVEPNRLGNRLGEGMSEDYAYILLYLERIVAIVTETRCSANNIHFNFFANLEGVDIIEYSQDGENYQFKDSPFNSKGDNSK